MIQTRNTTKTLTKSAVSSPNIDGKRNRGPVGSVSAGPESGLSQKQQQQQQQQQLNQVQFELIPARLHIDGTEYPNLHASRQSSSPVQGDQLDSQSEFSQDDQILLTQLDPSPLNNSTLASSDSELADIHSTSHSTHTKSTTTTNNNASSNLPIISTSTMSIRSSTFSENSIPSTSVTAVSDHQTVYTNSSTVGIPPASILDRARLHHRPMSLSSYPVGATSASSTHTESID